MRKKRFIAVGIIVAFLIIMVVKIYGVTSELTPELVRDRDNPETQEKIAEIVLNDIGKSDDFNASDVMDVNVFYGDVTGNSNDDVVIVVQIGPTYSFVAVYSREGDSFNYLGQIGPLFTVKNLQLMNSPALGKDFIVIRENVNQRIGAFENSTYIKMYLWDGEKIKPVGVFPESIHTDWNRAWDSSNPDAPNSWERITMDSDISVQNAEQTEIFLNLFQQYLISNDTVSKSIPKDSTYSVVSERTVPATLYWNDDWMYFIVSEKIENATGEKVAVIGDLADDPYSLVPEYAEETKDKYQILRKDGTEAIVDKSDLSDISS